MGRISVVTVTDFTALYQHNVTVLAGAAVVVAVVAAMLFAHRLRRLGAHRATLVVANILTVLAAVLATMVSASGMWKFFTEILGPTPLRYAFFCFIEVGLFASALLARARLLRDPQNRSGVDGAAVWVFAALTASLSALDSDSAREVGLRLAAPMIAAWMWERALAAERSARVGRTNNRIRWSPAAEHLLVRLRLAEAQSRTVTDADHARKRARLVQARLRLHLLENKNNTPAWRLRRAHNTVIRRAMQATEHLGLAAVPQITTEREAVQMHMATLYGFVQATSPQAVVHLNAWNPADTAQNSATATISLTSHRVDTNPPSRPSTNGHRPQRNVVEDDIQPRCPTPAAVKASPDHGGTAELRSKALPESRPSVRPQPITDGAMLNHDGGDRPASHPNTHEETENSAVASMRRFWDAEVGEGRIPTGAELSRAAGVPPETGLGRRKRRQWTPSLPDHLRADS